MAVTRDHDKLVTRLAQILIRLNEGHVLDPKALAEEFCVHHRTIQRDLHERFAYLPLKKENGGYRLEGFYLGKLTASDIRQFAAIAGIKGLFPSLDNGFLRSVLDTAVSQAYLVKGHRYEDTKAYAHLFQPLETAILKNQLIDFSYANKPRIGVAPYRLLNHKGIWYLAAMEGALLKSFKLAGISGFINTEQNFIPDPTIQERVSVEDGIWFTPSKREIVLKVDATIAPYFQRRQLVPEQQIDKAMEDGSLIVSARIGHDAQILPVIRYWIPHVHIIGPDDLQQALVQSISDYIKSDKFISSYES